MKTRFQINITYACNLACKWCIQFHDVMPWKKPMHIEVEDLKLAADILREHGIEVTMPRISGGEPTMHPKYEECVKAIVKHWDHEKVVVCTNTLISKPVEGVDKYRRSPPGWKEPRHEPWMISPDDLGIETPKELPVNCIMLRRCGRLFDAHGFGPCGNAGPICRILGMDPFSTKPIMHGYSTDMCKHCLSVLSKKKREAIFKDAIDGKIEWPTKTYREGLERELSSPTIFKTFQERFAEKEQ